MFCHILLFPFSAANIFCNSGPNIFKAIRCLCHKYTFTVYHDWRNSISALLIPHHKEADTLYNFTIIREPCSCFSINLVIGNHEGNNISGGVYIRKTAKLDQLVFIDIEEFSLFFFIPYHNITDSERTADKCIWPLFFQTPPNCNWCFTRSYLPLISTLVILMMNQKTILYLLCIRFCPLLMMNLLDLENSDLFIHLPPFLLSDSVHPVYTTPVPAL